MKPQARKTRSTEPERRNEEDLRNQIRIAEYRSKQARIKLEIIDLQDIPLKYIPNLWWLRRQAD